MDDMNCKGTENDISACQFNGWGNNDCGHGEDVGVECRMYIKVFSKDYNVKCKFASFPVDAGLFD